MNANVPAASVGYVRMAPEPDPWSRPVFAARLCNTLPTGYANHSPRTRLGGRTRNEEIVMTCAGRTPTVAAGAVRS